ncbi:hypothetical protein [Pyxidicoccus xibeiensis]|uniref:hypothetical protein n=1 Tax=Pyxidicoccus xibeiensis TaxID=2906759 RepID=UPI0020A6EEEE|nr:hypothetical protein [Pyxidicoccus xibeiensis]MCP3144894.1 hypothetical protein [Pyxidicoccus xibeiensis]
MKSPRNIHRPYTVEIVAEAWGQVAHLPTNTYRALQARLELVAAQAQSSGEGILSDTPSFQVEGLTVHYAVDSRRRLIQLLEVSRERSRPPASTSSATEEPTSRGS